MKGMEREKDEVCDDSHGKKDLKHSCTAKKKSHYGCGPHFIKSSSTKGTKNTFLSLTPTNVPKCQLPPTTPMLSGPDMLLYSYLFTRKLSNCT